MTSAGARDYNRGDCAHTHSRVQTQGSGSEFLVRGPLKLLFACGAKIISLCVCVGVCVIIASEASEKLCYPSTFHSFCATLGEFPRRGVWPDCPWNPGSNSVYKFSLFINVDGTFSRRLRGSEISVTETITETEMIDATLTETETETMVILKTEIL